jgi:NADH-ubiquinone oxidoreductase chain 5
MLIPLFLLGFGSIFIGYITKDMFIGLGSDFWGNAIYISPNNLNMIDAEFLPVNIKLLPVIFSISGATLSVILYTLFAKNIVTFKLSPIGKMTYGFLSKKWYFDKVYNEYVVQKLLDFGYNVSFKTLDRGLIEVIGPYGIANTINAFVKRFTNLQSGYVYHYAFVICISLTFFIFFYGLWFMIQDLFDIKLFFLFIINLLFISSKY